MFTAICRQHIACFPDLAHHSTADMNSYLLVPSEHLEVLVKVQSYQITSKFHVQRGTQNLWLMINYLVRIIASSGTVSLLASKFGKECCSHGVHFLDSWQIHCISSSDHILQRLAVTQLAHPHLLILNLL